MGKDEAAPPPPQGWYPDPTDESRQRYWDGERWTTHTGVEDPSAVAGLEAPRQRVGPVSTWHRASFVVTYLLGGLLFGPVAMRHAGLAQGALAAGDREAARAAGRRARAWSIVAGVTGLATVAALVWWFGFDGDLDRLLELRP